VEPNSVLPGHLETGKVCLTCKGPQGMDDKDACMGNGFLCKKCGCWRLPREVKPEKAD
jgi:hypothetical protein